MKVEQILLIAKRVVQPTSGDNYSDQMVSHQGMLFSNGLYISSSCFGTNVLAPKCIDRFWLGVKLFRSEQRVIYQTTPPFNTNLSHYVCVQETKSQRIHKPQLTIYSYSVSLTLNVPVQPSDVFCRCWLIHVMRQRRRGVFVREWSLTFQAVCTRVCSCQWARNQLRSRYPALQK